MLTETLRNLPKVDDLLLHEKLQGYFVNLSRKTVVGVVRSKIDEVRSEIKNDSYTSAQLPSKQLEDTIINRIIPELEQLMAMRLRRVINATGIILHTNLGRSLLSEHVKENFDEVAFNYNNLEYELEEGARGSRHSHIENLITDLISTEAAIVVNNNAAAVMLVLNEIAKGKEVIVSRGELVEIGGAFRIPDIIEQSNAIIREVGTTNKTHLVDYEKAICKEKTGALLKVHTSNFKITGFTSEVSLKELVETGTKESIPVIHDLGSGCLLDLSQFGIRNEPTIQQSVESGADIICFSCDKLLGGPQAGIIAGKAKFIERMKRNPLVRVFRVDKLTIAALESTLRLYYSEEQAISKIPTLRMIAMSKSETRQRAENLREMIGELEQVTVELDEATSQIGGGSLPGYEIPSWVVKIHSSKMSVNAFETALRLANPPIIARIRSDAIFLDVRTIREEELLHVANVIKDIPIGDLA